MFCKKLKQLRKEQSMTQEHLADLLNVSRTTVVRYEKGECEPDIATLIKLADIFNISLDYLLGRTEHRHNVSMLNKYNYELFIKFAELINQYEFTKK